MKFYPTIKNWHPQSYLPLKRHFDYFNPNAPVFQTLSTFPGIVEPSKVIKLRQDLAQCEDSHRMLWHMGDCAEPFEHACEQKLSSKIQFFKNILHKLKTCSRNEITMIGRIAGQYAKPRSQQYIVKDGIKQHNYKGDIVNSEEHRQPSEARVMQGYRNSVLTHNYIQTNMKELYTSHQGLILPFQAALTREVPVGNDVHYFNLSAHMLWIGQRTRQLDCAHVEFFRGIYNPIGVKVSSKIGEKEFEELVTTLNPSNQKGKLLVISRMGSQAITEKLSSLAGIKKEKGLNFLFLSDPMHGNTIQSAYNHKLKTRNYHHIILQLGSQRLNQKISVKQ